MVSRAALRHQMNPGRSKEGFAISPPPRGSPAPPAQPPEHLPASAGDGTHMADPACRERSPGKVSRRLGESKAERQQFGRK